MENNATSAPSPHEAARATLLAYGLSTADLESLTSQQSRALGEYTLRAEIDGAVLADDSEQGNASRRAPLIALADEKQLWVEVPPARQPR